MVNKQELFDIVDAEVCKKTVEESTVDSVEEWHRVTRNFKLDEVMKEAEKVSKELTVKVETASFAFQSQLENINENFDVKQTYQVRFLHCLF